MSGDHVQRCGSQVSHTRCLSPLRCQGSQAGTWWLTFPGRKGGAHTKLLSFRSLPCSPGGKQPCAQDGF